MRSLWKFGCFAALALCGCASSPPDDPDDPLEPANRIVYAFNEKADRYVLRPVAKGYEFALPNFVRKSINNFYSNLLYPTVIVNDILQLKMMQGGQDLARFIFNSTFGVAGFFDWGTSVGLEAHDEDFGQTLGHWGVGPGWYLMLPLLGPSDNRDLFGRAGDYGTNPVTYMSGDVSTPLTAVQAVDDRAQLLGADKVLEQQLDRYIFIRTIYLQRRLNLVYDGNPPKEEFDFGE